MTLVELCQRFAGFGAKPGHARALLRAWLAGAPLAPGAHLRREFLPARLREALPALAAEIGSLARVHSAHGAGDGSTRLLVALRDGTSVESVLLPRAGVCVSTQAGCAVGCVFCLTGRDGLARQLGSAEIIAQVALARSLREVRKVVFMGMGEPAHNLDNVLAAIDALADAGGIAHKSLVLSTVGDRRVFARLPQQRVKPALALSLHSTYAERRAELLPRAPRIDPAELVAEGERYARATHYPIQYQWTLLAGINDGDDEVERVAALLSGKYAVLNLIGWNAVEGMAFARPSRERMLSITRELHRRGILAKLRDSAGQDVDAGCGQLRSRSLRVTPVAAA